MDQSHIIAMVGHVESFLDSSIAAANHRNFLAAIKEPIAGRASRNTFPGQFLFTRKPQPFGLCTGCDNQRIAFINITAIAGHPKRTLGKVDIDDRVENGARTDFFSLRLHLFHQPWSLNDITEPGVIFDIGGDGQLTTRLQTLNHYRLQSGAGAIDSGRQSGWS